MYRMFPRLTIGKWYIPEIVKMFKATVDFGVYHLDMEFSFDYIVQGSISIKQKYIKKDQEVLGENYMYLIGFGMDGKTLTVSLQDKDEELSEEMVIEKQKVFNAFLQFTKIVEHDLPLPKNPKYTEFVGILNKQLPELYDWEIIKNKQMINDKDSTYKITRVLQKETSLFEIKATITKVEITGFMRLDDKTGQYYYTFEVEEGLLIIRVDEHCSKPKERTIKNMMKKLAKLTELLGYEFE